MVPEDDIKKGLDFYRIPYDKETISRLCIYLQELKKWNDHINLTGFKELRQIIRELIYDAFFVFAFIANDSSMLDMGSGAGVISIPSAIINSRIKVFSIDSNSKKINFQRHIRRLLRLERFSPIHIRLESIKDIEVDTVIAKGFGGIEDILCKGAGLIKKGGKILMLRGRHEEPVKYPGFNLTDNILYTLPYSSKTYRLFIYTERLLGQ